MAGGCQFDTTFSDISRTFKRVHVQFWNFLTFPKYQKQKFWKILNCNPKKIALDVNKTIKTTIQHPLTPKDVPKQKQRRTIKTPIVDPRNMKITDMFKKKNEALKTSRTELTTTDKPVVKVKLRLELYTWAKLNKTWCLMLQ